MNPAAANAPPLLLHLQAPADAGLAVMLGVYAPDARIESAPFRLQDWLRQAREPALEGVVLDLDGASPSDVRLLLASLDREPRIWLLILCGERGLAGCEPLLAAPRTAVLPKPWTPAGLEACLRSLRAAGAAAPGASDAFLAGLVEGLRDPLTSLGGYLQLLEHQGSPQSGELLRPAAEAARALERQIECLYLASAPLHARTESLDLYGWCAGLLDDARREDARIEAEMGRGLPPVPADARFLRAALDVGRLLLARFGPGGAPRLVASLDADGVVLAWEARVAGGAPPVGAPEAPPPPFLPELFERLAARVPARARIDRLRGVVPVRAALRWPQVRA